MDEYQRLLEQYNQQAQQIVNNSQAAIGQQAGDVQMPSSPSVPTGTTTGTTQSYSQPTNTGSSAQQTGSSMQQGLNDMQQSVNNAQQGVIDATQQAIAGATGGAGATQTQADAWAEWNALTAKTQNGTATPADYARAQELYPLLFGGQAQTPATDTTSGAAGTTGGTAGAGTGTQQPTGGEQSGGTQQQPGTISSAEAMAEWQAIMARVQAGTATPEDYARAQVIYGAAFGGGTAPANTAGTGTATGTGGQTVDANGNPVYPGVTTQYEPVQMDNLQRIRDMYDAQINAERAALQEQGDQALSDAQANRDKIADTYAKQRNAASVDWERQRRNFLEGANSSGLNTGAGSQAELSMMGMYQRGQNTLGASQAQAEAEADRNIADIKRSTQASINEAVMKNDYQKAAALLDEYKEQYNRAMDRAEALASFGDFSGYAAIYGNDVASNMFRTWAMQNPELALALGLITQQQFAQGYLGNLYKSYPALALYGAGYGGGGGGGGYSGGGGDGGSGDGGTSASATASSGGVPSYSGMTPGTYASMINSMIASGQIQGADVDRAHQLIQEAYAYGG